MSAPDKLVKLYIDQPKAFNDVRVDDFIIAMGYKTKTNSVYHIAEVRTVQSPKHPRMKRHHLKCYKTDLLTACKRDKDCQAVHPLYWYSRNKKAK